MSRVVFLLEEYSMKVFLETLLPRLQRELRFLCVTHEGKQDLEQSIPRKLRGWRTPGDRFVILRDNDGADCRELKTGLVAMCQQAGRGDTMVRIACQELEAWYFGDAEALAKAFHRDGLREIGNKARYRDPDAITQPARELGMLVDDFQKVSGARRMARELSLTNASRSYQVLMEGLAKLAGEVGAAGDQ